MSISVVVPIYNERENVDRLYDAILIVLERIGRPFEMILVNDGSTDGTTESLARLAAKDNRVRVIEFRRNFGQTAAMNAGMMAASGEIVVTLDADLQNDPADIPALLQTLTDSGADVVQGDRRAGRRDSLVRRGSSVAARVFRRWLLGDTIHDTGCSLRVLRREAALALPLQFRGMHRFIPLTCRQLGYRVLEQPVRHRPRTAGRSKYGIRNRALVGLIDCFAIRWMRSRRRPVAYKEVGSSGAVSPPAMPSTETRQKAPT